MKFVALALLLRTVSGEELDFNTDKLTDFQTDISIRSHGVLALGRNGDTLHIRKLDIQGHLRVDIASEKIHIKVKGSVVEDTDSGSPMMDGSADGFSELFIDMQASTFAVRETGWKQSPIGSAKGSLCLSGKFAPNIIKAPPGLMLKNMLAQRLKVVEQRLKMMLGERNGIATVDSGVVTVKQPGLTAVFGTDGTPIEIILKKIEVKFSNFVKGANVGTAFECEGNSATSSEFEVSSARSVELLQTVVGELAKHPETENLARALPNPATLFMQKKADEDATTFQQVLTFVAGSVFGGALVIAVAKAFKRKMELSEPLLADA